VLNSCNGDWARAIFDLEEERRRGEEEKRRRT